jgi:putative transposase
MQERGVSVDHSTVNCWVLKYSPQFEEAFYHHKRLVSLSWRLDETYNNRVPGQWRCLPVQ